MSPSKPDLPKQIVPYPSCTPLPVATPLSVANRYSALGSTVGQIRPSYQSTLVASYDPFAVDIPAGPSVPAVIHKKSSPYLPKSNSHLFVIEPIYDIHTNPIEIARHYFPPGFHYMPSSPYKSLSIIEIYCLRPNQLKSSP